MMNIPTKSLAMRRNMNLDLCMSSPSSSNSGSSSGNSICNLDLTLSTPSSSNCENNSEGERKKEEESGETQAQRMTIFYNGKVSVCDATEAQARIILECAKREAEEEKQRSLKISESLHGSPALPSQLCSSTETSMKRSLQKFLEKRRDRIQSTKSPYGR